MPDEFLQDEYAARINRVMNHICKDPAAISRARSGSWTSICR
jgi:hypothetical protein